MITEKDVKKRGFIYCPWCGVKIVPALLPEFTDNTIFGQWRCDNCDHQFVFDNADVGNDLE